MDQSAITLASAVLIIPLLSERRGAPENGKVGRDGVAQPITRRA